MEITLQPTKKQHLAYESLKDDIIKYVVFGGGAGGGKSWLGAEWILTNCILYPGTKWFIAREELKRLMSSSYLTFVKVCSHHKVPETVWKLNGQYNYIEFTNGSRVDLLDLSYKPSDPMYERFGSLEYTGGWIDEAGEVNFDAFDVLKSRVGRHMNKEYNLPSKVLLTCNPKKNFLYTMFYKPWKEDKLPTNCAFIQSLYRDNPYTADDYGENLSEIKNESLKSRLRDGNWNYDDDPSKIMTFDAIIDLWTNRIEQSNNKYLIVDVAGEGKDKATFYVWHGFCVKKIIVVAKCDSIQLEDEIVRICNEERIPRSQTLVDAAGIGWAIPGHLKVKGFTGAHSAIQPSLFSNNSKFNQDKKVNFANLRTQCYFLIAEKVNKREISIEPQQFKEQIIEELECIKEINDDNEKKLKIISKDDIKELIGRSPDHADNLSMRMYFELIPKTNVSESASNAAARYYANQ